MTKKKFLKQLKEKLEILKEEEINDIINEYSDIIDERIKNGEKEEDIINSYDINSLTEEILEAYKINPHAKETKEVIDKFEEKLSEFAKATATGFKNMFNKFKNANGTFNIDLIFEILIKVIFTLLLIIIIRIPFDIISNLGESVFSIMLYPLDKILTVMWQILVGLTYVITSIFLIINLFKKYFYLDEKVEVKKGVKKEKIIEEKKEVNNSIGSILKSLITIIFLFPLWCVNFGLFIAIAVVIYLLFKGISIIGVLILLIGLSLLFGFLADTVKNLINSPRKVSFIPFFISTIFIVFGGLMTAETSLSYNFHHDASKSNLYKEEIIEKYIYTNTSIVSDDKNIIIDDLLENNKIIIKIETNKATNINLNEQDNKIIINTELKNNRKEIYNLIIEDIKAKEIYDYSDIYEMEVYIYVNSETRNLIY